tara:strand:- start:1337 stop:1813 length:477 start_codon:yes stop_codon:yes gene_type:complete
MDNCRVLEYKFSNEIKHHIKNALPILSNETINFRPATKQEDSELSFDLVINLNFTVSIRIRKNKYINFKDLTIRSKSKNGYKCEIDKIKEGKAQIYFYAYMNKEEDTLIKVRMARVDVIRKLIEKRIFTQHKNNDGTQFIGIKFEDIKKNNGNIYKYN